MSVSSWRCLSFPAVLSRDTSGCGFELNFLPLKFTTIGMALGMGLLAGCISKPPTRSLYKTPGMSPAEWNSIDDHCSYEADKATAAADSKTDVTYTRHRLFNMCVKLKGATYMGRVTMAEEQWEPLSARCKAEAASAVSGQPASRKRDELQEDLESECYKKNGVVFHDNVYL